MTLILALDTVTDVGSVAMGRPGVLLAETQIGNRRHAAALAPTIAELLRVADAGFGDVSDIVLADGPGSFTGVRIGVATVQGITRAHPRVRVATAPSLMATAWSASTLCHEAVAVLYDALRGQVFAAIYHVHDRSVETLLAPVLTDVHALREQSRVRPGLALGTGAVAYADVMREWTGRPPVGPPLGLPRAAALLELFALPGAVQSVPDISAFDPTYGRPAEAQVVWERRHGTQLPRS